MRQSVEQRATVKNNITNLISSTTCKERNHLLNATDPRSAFKQFNICVAML